MQVRILLRALGVRGASPRDWRSHDQARGRNAPSIQPHRHAPASRAPRHETTPPSSSGPGCRPFTSITPVRIRLGVRTTRDPGAREETWACLPGGIGRRGALKRRCPSGRGGSNPSGGTGLQWCAESGRQASSGERSPAVIHGACWGTVTEKPLAGSSPVAAEGSWACSAVGSAPPWHGGGQGFDPPLVHHREQESPPHEVVRAVVMQSAGTPSASALGHGMEVRPVHGSSERMERGDAPLLRFGVWRRLVARPSGGRKVAGSNPAIPTVDQRHPSARKW